jgi:hypothetical protein
MIFKSSICTIQFVLPSTNRIYYFSTFLSYRLAQIVLPSTICIVQITPKPDNVVSSF